MKKQIAISDWVLKPLVTAVLTAECQANIRQSGFGNRISYFFQKYRNSVSETYLLFAF
jgi:hypothetical protein